MASAYSGLLIWHAGLSGSIPLKIAVAEGGTFSALMGGQAIPVTDTIFSWEILTICAVMLLTLPILNRLMIPEQHQVIEIEPAPSAHLEQLAAPANTPR